jgi:4-hydroxy-4-methyl-2-oxoglutarate aldolase
MNQLALDTALWRRFSTAAISDALDMLGINGGCHGLSALVSGTMTVGPAYTVQFDPAPAGERAPAAEFIDDVPAGSVVAIANHGRTDCTVWGDLLALTAQQRGVVGTVIDGAARDIAAITELGYPLWAVRGYMKSGKNRVMMSARQVPVTLGGTLVEPGDIVCADPSGVLVVPAARAPEVQALIVRIEEIENRIAAEVRAGVPLRDARTRHKYNDLALATARAN